VLLSVIRGGVDLLGKSPAPFLLDKFFHTFASQPKHTDA